jgi:hypothetical protein
MQYLTGFYQTCGICLLYVYETHHTAGKAIQRFLELMKAFWIIITMISKGEKRNGSVPSIVINEWYRKKLGDLSTKGAIDLNITNANKCIGWLISCVDHPQIIV